MSANPLPHDDAAFIWTEYASTTDVTGTPRTSTWDAFCDSLATPSLRPAKDGLPLVVLARLSGKRAIKNVAEVFALGFDFDDVPFSFDDLCAKLDGLDAVAYTTFSHDPPRNRYRAIVRLERPITRDAHAALYRSTATRLFGDTWDKACSDAVRMHYVPGCPSERQEHFRYRHLAGTPLPVGAEVRSIPLQILEGGRNAHLTQVVGAMIARRLDDETILAEAHRINETQCDPPLDEREVVSIVRGCLNRYPKGEPNFTDVGNAERFVAMHGTTARYCATRRQWLLWEADQWTWDQAKRVMEWAKQIPRKMLADSASELDKDRRHKMASWALQSESKGKLDAMLELASSAVPVSLDDIDADPWVLGVENGLVDLRTGKLLPATIDRVVTLRCAAAYDPTAECPVWRKAMQATFGGDGELIDFLQRAVGMSLLGTQKEQVMLFLYGSGENGKSVWVGTLEDMLGGYATHVAAESLMLNRNSAGGGARSDLVRLHRVRLVSAVEVEDGQELAEGLVKQMTGGDRITARQLYQAEFEFRPEFALWIAGNHRPRIRGTDHAIWRRVLLIPFEARFDRENPDRIEGLREKLRAEFPGILRWAVEGCLAYQRDGMRLNAPERVKAATRHYRKEQDTLGEFIEGCCLEDVGVKTRFTDIWTAYWQWCEDSGIRKRLSKQMLGNKLSERGFETFRDGKMKETFIRGLAPKGAISSV